MRTRVRTIAATITLVLLTATGCATPSTVAATPDPILDELRARLGVIDPIYFAHTVIDELPNAGYILSDGSVVPPSDSVVVGTVASVADVRGYILNGESVQEAGAEDKPAWRMVRVLVNVEEGWGTASGKREAAVMLPLASAHDLQTSIDSILALGRVLLILKGGHIAHNGEYLGLVDEHGIISYPLVTDPSATEGVRTLEELRAALARTREPVPAGPHW